MTEIQATWVRQFCWRLHNLLISKAAISASDDLVTPRRLIRREPISVRMIPLWLETASGRHLVKRCRDLLRKHGRIFGLSISLQPSSSAKWRGKDGEVKPWQGELWEQRNKSYWDHLMRLITGLYGT